MSLEKEKLNALKSIDRSLQSISKSLETLVQHVNIPLTEEQLRSEGYGNISTREDR
jgi:hypothetical protein